jgi:hypothetical protein
VIYPGLYVLDGYTPVPCPDILRWAAWMATADRHVALSIQDDVRVSTVFLGLDHNLSDHGPPVLFETMAFVGHDDVGQERYGAWAEAEEGHRRWVMTVFKPTPILALPAGTLE